MIIVSCEHPARRMPPKGFKADGQLHSSLMCLTLLRETYIIIIIVILIIMIMIIMIIKTCMFFFFCLIIILCSNKYIYMFIYQ